MAGRLLGVAGLLALGTACFQLPDDWWDAEIYRATDYTLDRPRVLAIRFEPPVVAHGLPVTVDALALGPDGAEAKIWTAEVCGVPEDVQSDVFTLDCFGNDALVESVADSVPFAWDPPDLRGVPCAHVHDSDLVHTDDGWWLDPCRSSFPMLLRADAGGEAHGVVWVNALHDPYPSGGAVPASIHHAARSLTTIDDPVAGGEVELVFSIAFEPDPSGFRWFIDAGELLGTGRTVVHSSDGWGWTTRNTLRIPRDYSGPLRVVVVTQSLESGREADMTWQVLTLDVR